MIANPCVLIILGAFVYLTVYLLGTKNPPEKPPTPPAVTQMEDRTK